MWLSLLNADNPDVPLGVVVAIGLELCVEILSIPLGCLGLLYLVAYFGA